MLTDGQLLDMADKGNHIYHIQIGNIYSPDEMRSIFPPNGIPTFPTDVPEHFASTIGGIRLTLAGDEMDLEFYQRPNPAQIKALKNISGAKILHVTVTDPVSGKAKISEEINGTQALLHWLRQVKWPETTTAPK